MSSKRGPNSRAYTAKATDMLMHGEYTMLTGCEMIRHLLDKQQIDPRDFSVKLGYEQHYFDNLFNTRVNRHGDHLPRPLIGKLAQITHTAPALWRMHEYDPAVMASVRVDMDVEITAGPAAGIAARSPRTTGR